MNDLEDALRTMLRTRAHDITELPAHLIATDTARDGGTQLAPTAARGVHHRWLPALVAAAAAAAVAVGITIGVRITNSTPPSHQRGTPTTHHTPQPTPTGTLTPRRCIRSLPAAWVVAFTNGSITAPKGELLPPLFLSLDSSGDVIGVDYTAQYPRTYKVVRAAPNQPLQTLYELPSAQPAPARTPWMAAVSVEGKWAAFPAVVPSAGGEQPLIKLLNLDTKAVRTIREVPDGTSVLGERAVVDGGAVYWAELHDGRGYGRMYRYDIASGRRTVLDEHATSGPLAAVDGVVYWNRGGTYGLRHIVIDIASSRPSRFLPAGVAWAQALTGSNPVLLAGPDGTHFWQDVSGAIMAERPGSGGPVTIVPSQRGPALAGVTGHYVWGEDDAGGNFVTDLRTGAAAHTKNTLTFAGSTGNIAAFASGDVAQLATLDTSNLPDLHC